MEALPDDFDAAMLPGLLAGGWGFEPESADYAPVGAGSYHWMVRDRAGERAFVTVDDLDQKGWLGSTRDAVFDGLQRAFGTAQALCHHGLDFVVAPLPTTDGRGLERVGPRYTLAVFPFVEGRSGTFDYASPGDRAPVVPLLAALHAATPAVEASASLTGLVLPGREHLEAAFRDLRTPWSGGPFSEPARAAFAEHRGQVVELLAETDRLAAHVERRGGAPVITHGEPHAGNVMQAGSRRLLVDWDTVSLAPPERDLWLVVDTADEAELYEDATGRTIDHAALAFFRLTWDLKDLAEYVKVLRRPHVESGDTQRAFDGLVCCMTGAAR